MNQNQKQGFKHKAHGPKSAQQRFQSGPLTGIEKCECKHPFWNFYCVFRSFKTFLTYKELPCGHSQQSKIIKKSKVRWAKNYRKIPVFSLYIVIFTVSQKKFQPYNYRTVW